ncbi:hypothetical protein LTR85_002964 [Meristemomyces frigidus]|nr:hypothetical protein LTR85_002964 [Meristemomyces frigidus]
MAASTRVFDTYELLKNILLHLPFRDLLLAESVSKSFQSLIERSKKIRAALFRTPFVDGLTVEHGMYRVEVDQDGEDYYGSAWQTLNEVAYEPVINPFINNFGMGSQDWNGAGLLKHDGFINPSGGILSGKPVGNKVKVFTYKHASWRKMLAFQPPPSSVQIHCAEWYMKAVDDYDWNPDDCAFSADFERGVTVDRLRKTMIDHWMECPDCPHVTEREGPGTWSFRGEMDVEQVPLDPTGWQMLEAFGKACLGSVAAELSHA